MGRVTKFSDILRTVSTLVEELASLYDKTHIPQEGTNPGLPAVEFEGNITINGPVAGQSVNDSSLREHTMLAQQLRFGGDFDETQPAAPRGDNPGQHNGVPELPQP